MARMREHGLILLSRSRTGHRGAYEDFVQRLFGGTVKRSGLQLATRGTLFFLMVEEGFMAYFASAFLRALIGRRTVGLLFRPGPALKGNSLRLRFKRGLLRLLKAMPSVATLSIVPFPLQPRFAEIADGWIYDFQLWDMGAADYATVAALREGRDCANPDAVTFHAAIVAASAGKPVVVALGVQSRSKGFVRLAAAAEMLAAQGWQIVVAGRIDPALAAEKARLEELGALIADRFVSDGEILGAYAGATAVWACYDPSYDQSSGILGRAVQFGCSVVVRKGSLSETFCEQEGYPFLAVAGEIGAPLDLSALPAPDVEGGRTAAERFRVKSLAVLAEALQVAPLTEGAHG